jgi:hypothetical protein
MMDIQAVPPVNSRRSWIVPDGKGLPGKKGTIRKTGIEYLCGSEREAVTLRDNCRIAIRKRRPDQFNEQWAQGWPKHGCLPVHPAFRVEARPDVCWAELAIRALLCQIADDHVRFPELKIAVLGRGNEPVRVQHTIFRCFGNAELVTCIDPMILQAEFAAHQSTFWTLMELAQPQIFSISIGPHWSARGIWTASGPPTSVPESGGKFVRQHGRLANLRRCGKQISGVGH